MARLLFLENYLWLEPEKKDYELSDLSGRDDGGLMKEMIRTGSRFQRL